MIGGSALGRAPLFACLRSFMARDLFCPGHRSAIPYIDDVNIYLTGVAVVSRSIFTLSTFGSAIHARVISASIGHSTSPSCPGHLPQPPDRVRARPVLHLEEPAALPPQLQTVH
jgi:hypothetical protein